MGPVVFVSGNHECLENPYCTGLFYLILAIFYLPFLDTITVRYLKVNVPFWIKMSIAILILWATLAVGDLAELYGL